MLRRVGPVESGVAATGPKGATVAQREEFLPTAHCVRLIHFFDENIAHYGYEDPQGFWSNRLITDHRLCRREDREIRVLLNQIKFRVMDEIRDTFEAARVYPQASQLVIWPEGTRQEAHLDTYFCDTKWSAIVYLNDDFEGGETFFSEPEALVAPKVGALLVFEGGSVAHGVKQIRRGTRYTNALWFTDDPGGIGP